MKIQFLSDLHLEFRDNARWLKEHRLPVVGDVLVLAGDIIYLGDESMERHSFWDWASDNFEHVIAVPGNHEYYKYYDLKSLNGSIDKEIRHNVHYYHNNVLCIDGVAFICSTLWSYVALSEAYATEHAVTDFHRIMYGDHLLTSADFNKEHERSLSFIKSAVAECTAQTKIVVTHHVPSYLLSSPEFKGNALNGAFTVELGDFIASSDIDYWIYGHSHRNIDVKIGNTSCVSNQLGYTFHGEEKTFVADRILDI